MTPVTIDSIVRAAIVEAGYKNLRKYILFLHFAFDALYKMKRDNVIVGFRFISIPVVNRHADIPTSVLALGQIGWQRGQRVGGFVSDPNLSLDPAAQANLWYPIENGNCHGNRYRIDRSVSPAQIILEHQPKDNLVYVEVIDQSVTPNTETLVPQEAVLPMKSYIHFRQARFKMGAASAESKAAENEYMDEADEALAGLSDLGPAYLKSALLRGNGLQLGPWGAMYGGYNHWF